MTGPLMEILGASAARAPWGWGLLFMALLGYFKIWPKLREISNKREMSLLDNREAHIAKLDLRIDRMEKNFRAERIRCEAEVASLRHRINNVDQRHVMLITLVKMAPSKIEQHLETIETMRQEHLNKEANEQKALMAELHRAETISVSLV